MPRSSSCRARSTGSPGCARIASDGGGDCGAAAGIPAHRVRLCAQAQPDAAGDAMARAGTADLLRAVSRALDPDPGEGRPNQGADRRRRRRAGALGAGDVAVVPRLKALLAKMDIDGPAFTSIFQGATRWQTFVALAVSGNLFGDAGLALASVAMVAIIPLVNVFSVAVLAHYAATEKRSVRSIVMTVVRNPLIWACAIGLALNVLHVPLPRIWHEVADALGRCSLAIGLLVTGAGLHLDGLFRPSTAAGLGVFLKLILMPVLAVALALWFGLSGQNLVIVTACSAVPASSSAYVLARQMGGDAPLLAQIITLQTILAAITMPIAIALVA